MNSQDGPAGPAGRQEAPDALPLTVGCATHRALGTLVTITPAAADNQTDDSQAGDNRAGGEGGLRLLPDEAATVARALTAVADGRSSETEIYLSPVASDGAFTGLRQGDQLAVTIDGRTWTLNWPAVRLLAQRLAAAADR